MTPSRKSILSAKGFTCNNWFNNWSFVNHDRKLVCFTGWVDLVDSEKRYHVLSDTWEIKKNGHKRPGYKTSLSYINEYVKRQGYKVCVLRHEAIDPTNEKRTIKDIILPLIFGVLEQDGSEYFVRPSE